MIMKNIDLNCWMANLPDELKLTQINIPGTHDSTACYASFSFVSKTQSLTVAQQLDAGVRFFDFRFCLENDTFYAKHGIASCKKSRGFFAEKLTADDVVSDCISFLTANPTETILFALRDTTGAQGDAFFSKFYSKYICNNSKLWFTQNRIPTLKEVRGKITLLRNVDVDKNKFTDNNSGINFRPPYIGTKKVDDWRRGDILSIETDEKYSEVFIQDSYKVNGMKKWGTIKRFLDLPLRNDEFNVCMTSCVGVRGPYFNAKMINKKIMGYIFEKGKMYGIVAMDFVDKNICEKIILVNENC